jgi:hypothetical protein
MNTEGLITKIRNIIADNTSLALTDVYSPELPQEKENICAVTLIGGNPKYNLCGSSHLEQTFRVLIRGTINDTTTRALADEIYSALDLQKNITFNSNTIVQILAITTPIYVGKDENQRILYNITFKMIIE